ncbi:DUF1878 family protein [Bacillus sp. 2205SS5-2]|uniref:DUF1878 family protein n=1 Tax=Bacillus sp. 2205SS5-2 TaxID=3109031 RepID=UPI0030042135
MSSIEERLEKLEFHHKLMMNMLDQTKREFDYIVIARGLSQAEVEHFYNLCEQMNKKREAQKAEKFVFYAPLFNDFKNQLHPKLSLIETIDACLKQGIYPELMLQLKKNL